MANMEALTDAAQTRIEHMWDIAAKARRTKIGFGSASWSHSPGELEGNFTTRKQLGSDVLIMYQPAPVRVRPFNKRLTMPNFIPGPKSREIWLHHLQRPEGVERAGVYIGELLILHGNSWDGPDASATFASYKTAMSTDVERVPGIISQYVISIANGCDSVHAPNRYRAQFDIFDLDRSSASAEKIAQFDELVTEAVSGRY